MELPSSRPGRRHHLVPQFYLRRFAADGKRLVARDRDNPAVAINLSVRDAAVRCGFYDVPSSAGPNGVVEDALAGLEDVASPVIAKLLESGFDSFEMQDRYRLSLFMGLQCVRGVDFTRTTFAVAEEHDRLRTEGADDAVRVQVADALGITPAHLGEGEVVAGMPPAEDRPPQWWLRTAGLAIVADEIGGWLFVRNWSLFVAPQECLLTSDRPVVLFRSGNDDGEPTGFANADIVVMPLSRRVALLMTRDGFDVGSYWSGLADAANAINAIVSVSSYQWIFHHPADAIPQDLTLPPRTPDATSESPSIIVEGDRVRVRTRVMPNLPTPPPGWLPPRTG